MAGWKSSGPTVGAWLNRRGAEICNSRWIKLHCGGLFEFEVVNEGADLCHDCFGAGGGERISQDALRSELRAALGVAGHKAHELLGVDGGVFGEADLQLGALAVDLRDADAFAFEAQGCGFEQVRQWSRAAGRSGLPSRRAGRRMASSLLAPATFL